MGLSPKECLICLNSIETLFIPTEESQKIFNICCSYIKDAINIEFLVKNYIGNGNRNLTFCKNCLECSGNLAELVEQLSKIKQEINSLTNSFSETIAKQRTQATANTIKQFNNENKKICMLNNQSGNLSSSNRASLPELAATSGQHSFLHLETSNELKVEQADDGTFLDFIDESCPDNASSDNEEKYTTNRLESENEQEIDPFGEIESESTCDIPNSCNTIWESEPQIGDVDNVETTAELVSVSSVTMPNIVPKRMQNVVPSNSSGLLKTFHRDKSVPNLIENLPGSSGANCNSRKESTFYPKNRTGKMGGRKYKHNCPICQKSFISPCDVRKHEVSHTGERSYKCTVCEKAYKHAKDLRIHERRHRGEKPYKCLLCGNSFTRLDSLKIHEKTHSSGQKREKQYKCSFCECSFVRERILKYHEKTHNIKEETY